MSLADFNSFYMSPWVIDTKYDLTPGEEIERFLMQNCEDYALEYPEDEIQPIHNKLNMLIFSRAQVSEDQAGQQRARNQHRRVKTEFIV